MKKIEKLIVSDKSIPSILFYSKKGILITHNKVIVNFTDYYMKDKYQSLDYLDYLIENVECKKHYYQLMSLKKDIYDEIFE
jgi:hypothetical protein